MKSTFDSLLVSSKDGDSKGHAGAAENGLVKISEIVVGYGDAAAGKALGDR